MGYLKDADSCFNDDDEVNWRKITPAKCDLSRSLLVIPKNPPELTDLPGDIRVWTGWPLFDVKVVQFKTNQWLQAAGLMDGCGGFVGLPTPEWKGDLLNELALAEAGILKIMEWNRASV